MANGLDLNTKPLYQPASMDFSGVGDNLEQIGMQLMSFQQEQQRMQQRRKDMMWQRFSKLYNVQPVEAIQAGNQKEYNRMYNNMIKELDHLSAKIDENPDNWEIYQEGIKTINKYRSKVNNIKAQEKQYQQDLQIAYNKQEELTQESLRSIMGWRGFQRSDEQERERNKGKLRGFEGYTGEYQGFVRTKPKDLAQHMNSMRETLKEGGLLEVATTLNMNTAGEVMELQKTIKNGENPYWNYDPETGEIEKKPIQKLRLKSELSKPEWNRAAINELRKMGKIVDREKGIFKVGKEYYSVDFKGRKTTEDGKTVNNLIDFVDKYYNPFPRPEITKTTKTVTPKGTEGELTQEEKKQRHYISQGQRYEKFGEVEFETYVGLGQRNLEGEAAFDVVKDPTTNQTVDIGDTEGKGKTRPYKVLGIDPYTKKMLVALEGSDLKRTAFGKELPKELKGMLSNVGNLKGEPDMIQPRLAVVDANRYRNLLEQEVFFNKETQEPIFSGGAGIRPKEQAEAEEQEQDDPLGIF
jgi:hypothetical protein